MRRERVGGHVVADVLRAPGRQRADTQPLVVRLEDLDAGTGRRLEALASRNAYRKAFERRLKRTHLADVAAGVGIAAVQGVVGVEAPQGPGIGAEVAQVGEAEVRCEFLLVVQRLLEEHQRVEHQHGQVAVDLGDHVQQHGGVGAEGGDQRHLAGELGMYAGDHVLRPRPIVDQAQRLDPLERVRGESNVVVKPHRSGPPAGRGQP